MISAFGIVFSEIEVFVVPARLLAGSVMTAVEDVANVAVVPVPVVVAAMAATQSVTVAVVTVVEVTIQ